MTGFTGGADDDVFNLADKGMLAAGDVIDGKGGNDTLKIDYYDDSLDLTKITLTSVEAIDQTYFSGTVTLQSSQLNGLSWIIADKLVIADTGQTTLVGSGGMNEIDLSDLGGHLDMSRFTCSFTSPRAPYIYGGTGKDVVVGSSADDYMRGYGGDDNLSGGLGTDVLDGGAENDILHGDAGDDTLIGGAGMDKLYGDAGNDTLMVGDANPNMAGEAYDGGAGTDMLDLGDAMSVDLSMATITEVEKLSGEQTSATLTVGQLALFTSIDVEGIVLADGGDVNFAHVHLAPRSQPAIQLSAAGNSVALAGAAIHNVTGGDGNDSIKGGTGSDTFFGGGGNDMLDGGGGADLLEGGDGNDTYYVNDSGDIVLEDDPNGGTDDAVHSTIDYTLGANVEDLYLSGTALNGTGNDLANRIYGTGGNNVLDGGAGADSLHGGAGDDTYYVDDTHDSITELAGGGTDTVHATATFTLNSNVENLTLSGSANINGTGNALANILYGNSGANILNGGAGADTMRGGAGDDVYFVDNPGDVVAENANGGTDKVESAIGYTLGANVENLRLTGSASVAATGNTLANTITGNAGDNMIDGKAGSDTLYGAAGKDSFVFDTALGASNIDTIADFTVGQDLIDLDRSIFKAIGADGALAAGAFYAGTAAHDADDRIVYDPGTGDLYYDADGNGSGKAVQFATLGKNLKPTSSSFGVMG